MNDFVTKENIKEAIPGFDYDKCTEEQKQAVNEVLRIILEQYKNIDLNYIKTVFKILPKKYFNPEDSRFVQFAKKHKIVWNIQGHIREGNDITSYHYPMISFSDDIRKFDNMLVDFEKNITKLALSIKKK